jgi:hypothetical protein
MPLKCFAEWTIAVSPLAAIAGVILWSTDAALAAPTLSPAQRSQLSRLGIPIVLPTYLPAGFRVVNLEATACPPTAPRTGLCREGASYQVVYRGDRTSCVAVRAIGGGVGGGSEQFQYDIPTRLFGSVTLGFGQPYGGPNSPQPQQLQQPQANLASFPAQLRSRGKSPYYSVAVIESEPESSRVYTCGKNTSFSPRELEKVVRSLQVSQ